MCAPTRACLLLALARTRATHARAHACHAGANTHPPTRKARACMPGLTPMSTRRPVERKMSRLPTWANVDTGCQMENAVNVTKNVTPPVFCSPQPTQQSHILPCTLKCRTSKGPRTDLTADISGDCIVFRVSRVSVVSGVCIVFRRFRSFRSFWSFRGLDCPRRARGRKHGRPYAPRAA